MHVMLLGGNQTDRNTLKRFLTPYQYSTVSTLPLMSKNHVFYIHVLDTNLTQEDFMNMDPEVEWQV